MDAVVVVVVAVVEMTRSRTGSSKSHSHSLRCRQVQVQADGVLNASHVEEVCREARLMRKASIAVESKHSDNESSDSTSTSAVT